MLALLLSTRVLPLLVVISSLPTVLERCDDVLLTGSSLIGHILYIASKWQKEEVMMGRRPNLVASLYQRLILFAISATPISQRSKTTK